MAFLLDVEPLPNGTTRVEYDVSPTERVQLVTLSEQAHLVLDENPNDLIGLTLAEVRAPIRSRRRFQPNDQQKG
jgi:hypothetical protein